MNFKRVRSICTCVVDYWEYWQCCQQNSIILLQKFYDYKLYLCMRDVHRYIKFIKHLLVRFMFIRCYSTSVHRYVLFLHIVY